MLNNSITIFNGLVDRQPLEKRYYNTPITQKNRTEQVIKVPIKKLLSRTITIRKSYFCSINISRLDRVHSVISIKLTPYRQI